MWANRIASNLSSLSATDLTDLLRSLTCFIPSDIIDGRLTVDPFRLRALFCTFGCKSETLAILVHGLVVDDLSPRSCIRVVGSRILPSDMAWFVALGLEQVYTQKWQTIACRLNFPTRKFTLVLFPVRNHHRSHCGRNKNNSPKKVKADLSPNKFDWQFIFDDAACFI